MSNYLRICRVCQAKQSHHDYEANGSACVACGKNPVTPETAPAYDSPMKDEPTPEPT